MKQMKLLICLFLISLFNLSSTGNKNFPELVKGKILDKSTQLPIERVYIYIISGEEEALSSGDGSFEIATWQAFPLKINISHKEYQALTVAYQNAGERPVIQLVKK